MMKRIRMILFCVLISWITFPNLSIYAEEEADDAQTQMIAENIEEFLENLKIDEEDESGIMTFSSELYKGERIGKHYHNGQFVSYITKMYVDGQLAYCLEPSVLIPGGAGSTIPGYEASSVLSYDRLDYATKVKVWKIAYYGYGYNNHYENERFAATQCLIWDAINEPQEAYTMSGELWDLSAIKSEIMDLVTKNPAGQVPSFAGNTVRLSLNKATQLTDQNQVLPNYAVPDAKNIAVNQNGNELTLTLENSSDFASSLNASGSVYNALIQSVIWKNADYQIMFTQHAEPMKDFSLFFELDSVPFTIIKLDRQSGYEAQGEADLTGAVISIRDALTQEEVLKLNMNDSNTITYESLPAKEYLACEISAPKGYVLNPQCVSFSTSSGQPVSVEIFDEVIKGQIQIIKKDEETGKAPLNQGEFSIFDSKGNLVDTVVISKGEGISRQLPYGHYTIKEETAPKGYVLSDEDKEIFIEKENQIITVEITNKPQKGIIKVIKRDEESYDVPQGEASLEKVVYQIFAEEDIIGYDGTQLYKNHDLVEMLEAEGITAVSSKLPLGSYQICEQTPSVGYNLNPGCKIVELSLPDQTEEISLEEIDFTNQVIKGRIAITKFIVGDEGLKEDRRSGVVSAGQGFYFDIISLANNEIADTLITDENGYAVSGLLPYGRYKIKERDREGIEAAEEFEVMINEEGKIFSYILENDVFEAELTIFKMDKETKKRVALPNASFKIKDSRGNFITQTVTYPQKEEIDTFITDETGSIHLPSSLSYGTYSICEIHAPYGYVLNSEELEFQVDGTNKEITVEFENMPAKGKLIIEKTGEVLSGFTETETPFGIVYVPQFEKRILDGVSYRIYAREDIITPDQTLWYHANETVEEITTAADKATVSSNLPLGAYSLQEIRTKDGYVRDDRIYDFDLRYENETVEVTGYAFNHCNERKKGSLHYEKAFESSLFDESADPREDVVFGLFNAEDIQIEDEIVLPKGSMLGYSFLNKENNGSFDLLLEGNYFIKEIQTADGYALNETEYPITLNFTDSDEKEVHINLDQEILNETKKGSLTVLKKDEFDEELPVKEGFVFELAADEDFDKIVAQAETDESGKAVFDNLEIGTYYVRERDCPIYYLLSQEVIQVEVSYQTNTELDFVDKRKRTSYKIHKVDAENPGIELKEAEFAVRDLRTDQEIFRGRTDKNGFLEIGNLVWGETYEICETLTPDGYTYLQNSNGCQIWKAELAGAEEISVHQWENQREKGHLHLIKTDEYGAAFTGSVFEISSSETFEEILYTVETDEKGEVLVKDISTGIYYLREIDCLDFFELNSGVAEIKIQKNETAEIVFENRYRDVGLQLVKMNEKKELLDDAEFVVVDITDKKVQETYFITLGSDADLNEYFPKDTRLLSSDEGVIAIEGMKIHAGKEGECFISAVDASGVLKKVILVRSVNETRDGQFFWKDTIEIEKTGLVVPDTNDKILFKGKTGHEYLHLTDPDNHNLSLSNQQVAFYKTENAAEPVIVKMSDEYGMISLDDLECGKWFYQTSKSSHRVEIELLKSKGELAVQGLKWGRIYLLIETVLPKGMTYASSPIEKIECTFDINEDVKKITVFNQIRKASLKVIKVNEAQDKRLNGADFILKDKAQDKELDEKISGTILLKDSQDCYYLSEDEEMKNILCILEPNESDEILKTLPEGTYYLQKKGEMMEEVQCIKIEKGTLIFHDLEVNKEYILYEKEAPAGYLRNENEISVVLNPDFLSDQTELVISNSQIVIPNMGDR